jgi:protein-S-isoprenylcysteine O-methyltransferase Ste14
MALKEEFVTLGNRLFRNRGWLPFLFVPFLVIGLAQAPALTSVAGAAAGLLWTALSVLVSCAGLLVRCAVVGFTPKGTSGRNTAEGQVAETVNVSGFYSACRHPLYLGNFLIFLGLVLYLQVPWLVLLAVSAFWLYYERIMFAEEEFLRSRFGATFEEWAARTPAFWPDFRLWKDPDLAFSFRNVLRREYTAFFEIVAGFVILHVFRNVFLTGRLELDAGAAAAFGGGLLVYAVLRTLKRKTRLLTVEGR